MIGPSHDFPAPTTNKIIPSKITTFLHTRLAFEKVPQLGKISFFIFIFFSFRFFSRNETLTLASNLPKRQP